MKKLLQAVLLGCCLLVAPACSKKEADTAPDKKCGFYNGNQLYLGPQGGCYYINANNNKEYVTRSYCNC